VTVDGIAQRAVLDIYMPHFINLIYLKVDNDSYQQGDLRLTMFVLLHNSPNLVEFIYHTNYFAPPEAQGILDGYRERQVNMNSYTNLKRIIVCPSYNDPTLYTFYYSSPSYNWKLELLQENVNSDALMDDPLFVELSRKFRSYRRCQFQYK
jgi:hypothetical protein